MATALGDFGKPTDNNVELSVNIQASSQLFPPPGGLANQRRACALAPHQYTRAPHTPTTVLSDTCEGKHNCQQNAAPVLLSE